MTIHKSQGSEAKSVVFCLSNYHKAMLYRNLPYVAMSRGRKQVDFVGELDALVEAAKHEIKNKRITLLGRYLRMYSGEFIPV
jgi:exodeoxyribonuclease V alpha subunit